MQVSIIIPIYNEIESLRPLHDRVSQAMDSLPQPAEVIYVNDGSNDGSNDLLDEIAAQDGRVVVVHFRRNYGQTAAMQAGLEHATGKVLVTMDGDLQNDPDDIRAMLTLIDQGGYDLVHGWRKQRQDAWLTRKLPSLVANRLISRVTGLEIHDLGCTLKAIRSEVAAELDLYGEMHRFIPILAHARGARCKEFVVNHHERQFGESKYGLSRTTRVLLDLITVKFLIDYLDRPMKLLGRLALGSLGLSIASGSAALLMKVIGGVDLTGNPLTLLTVFMGIVSLQFFGLGLLGEMNTRMYYQRSNRRAFAIRSVTRNNGPVGVYREAA